MFGKENKQQGCMKYGMLVRIERKCMMTKINGMEIVMKEKALENNVEDKVLKLAGNW